MAGCTVSVILFVVAMNLILKVGGAQCKGPVVVDSTRLPECRAFMDDITVMTPSVVGTKWILRALEKMASWARMTFKPEKSRSLCIVKGKLTNNFSIQRVKIPTIQSQEICCLGKIFDSSIKSCNSRQDTIFQLNN